MSKYTNDELPTLEDIPSLIANEENCADMDKFEKCMIYHVEQCDDKTPANLVGSLFKFVRNETPCRNFNRNSGKTLQTSVVLVFVSMFLTFLR